MLHIKTGFPDDELKKPNIMGQFSYYKEQEDLIYDLLCKERTEVTPYVLMAREGVVVAVESAVLPLALKKCWRPASCPINSSDAVRKRIEWAKSWERMNLDPRGGPLVDYGRLPQRKYKPTPIKGRTK